MTGPSTPEPGATPEPVQDALTVLTVKRGVMAKRHKWLPEGRWKTADEPEGDQFTWHELVVTDIHTLAQALGSLERDTKSIVIRDVPIDGIDLVVRRLAHAAKDGTPPSFERHHVGRRWVMLDIDKAPPPPPEVATGPCVEAVEWTIREYLPAPFHGVTCFYQWSGNAGVKPWTDGVRLHLWFWLSGPVCEEAWRAWAVPTPHVDQTIFDRVHIHYTAHPIFDGAPDPISERSGLLEHRLDQVAVEMFLDEAGSLMLVDAPTWCARQAVRVELDADTQAERYLGHLPEATNRRQAWAQKKLEESIREILSLPKGSRNDLIFRIVLAVGRVVDAGGLDRSDTLRALEDAAVAVGDSPNKDRDVTRRAFERGLNDPRDLSHIGTEPVRPKAETHKPEAETHKGPEPHKAQAPKVELADYYCTKDRRLTVDGRAITRDEGRWQIGKQVVPGVQGAPQPDAAVPVGFYITPWGVGAHTNGDKAVPIVPCPVFVQGRCYDVHARSYALLITWRDPAGWHRRLIPREEAFSNRVQVLARWGLPVTSESAKGLVRYLQAYEAENFRLIPTLKISRTMGWQDNDPVEFLLGFKRITKDGVKEIDVDRWTSATWSDEVVAYRPMDAGDRQYAEAFVSRGTWSAWVEAVRMMRPYPKAMIGVLASFSSVMLEVLHANGFAIDWAAPPGTGKGTLLRAAESVWGDPHELRRMWDGSSVFYERSFATLHSLPLFVDDTKRATTKGNDDIVPEVIYMAENGRGRGRGNLVHTDETPRWRTLLFSTGEHPATSIGNHGGAKSRCIEVSGLPFRSQQQGPLVTFLDEVFSNNYGMAGERFVRWLLEQRARWGQWQELFQELYRHYTQDIRSGAESRLAGARAVLEVTRRCVEEALDLRMGDPVNEIWSHVTSHATDADGSLRSLEELISFFAANRESFMGGERGEGRQPHGGWLGQIQSDVVAFFPQTIDRFLKERGHQRSVLDVWRDRGWTVVDTDRAGRVDKRISIRGAGGERPRCVCVRYGLMTGQTELDPGLVTLDPGWVQEGSERIN